MTDTPVRGHVILLLSLEQGVLTATRLSKFFELVFQRSL